MERRRVVGGKWVVSGWWRQGEERATSLVGGDAAAIFTSVAAVSCCQMPFMVKWAQAPPTFPPPDAYLAHGLLQTLLDLTLSPRSLSINCRCQENWIFLLLVSARRAIRVDCHSSNSITFTLKHLFKKSYNANSTAFPC